MSLDERRDGSGLGSYDYSAFEVADYACVELAPLGAKAVTAQVSDQTLGGVKFTFGDATDEASRTIVVLEEPSAANSCISHASLRGLRKKRADARRLRETNTST